MKLKLGQLVLPTLQMAYAKLMAAELPIKKAFEMKTLTSRIGEEGKKFQELLNKIQQKYGEKDKEGTLKVNKDGIFEIKGEKTITKYNKEIRELNDIELDLNVPALVLEDLGDNVKFSTQDVIALEVLFPTLFPQPEKKEEEKTEEPAKATA
jgi:hypothetical protein